MRSVVALAALVAAAALGPPAASAASLPDPAPYAYGASAFALPLPSLTEESAPVLEAVSYVPARTRFESTRYRPRSRHSRSSAAYYGNPVQIHAGFFEPEGDGATSFALGLRGGPQVDPNIQIGAGVDWIYNSDKQRVVRGDPYVQGGTTITPERVLSRSSSHLFPIMGYLQLGGGTGAVAPYFGVAGGYEVLVLEADDYTTGESFEATFGGWGWQAWAGLGLPLSGQTRLTGEVFVNQSEAEREVTDFTGVTYREIVDLDGVGMRFGLSWGY